MNYVYKQANYFFFFFFQLTLLLEKIMSTKDTELP